MAQIIRATTGNIEAVARLFRSIRTACLPYLPDIHTPAEDLCYFRDRVFRTCEVWIAGADELEGFCAFRPGWVDHLYVRPDRHGQGLGTTLLGRAMQDNTRLQLWAFRRNTRAIRFYLARGFHRVSETDGSGNEEREPDALFAWEKM
jgi:putative acetyltransferase